MKLVLHADKYQRFLEIDTVIFGVFCMPKNNKFDISLQYLKKEVSDEMNFLHAGKHESFPQIDTMIFDGDVQAFPKLPKLQVCNVFTTS